MMAVGFRAQRGKGVQYGLAALSAGRPGVHECGRWQFWPTDAPGHVDRFGMGQVGAFAALRDLVSEPGKSV
jgi:hypothetical protein